MKKFGRTVRDKLISTIYLVFRRKPCLQDLKEQEYPGDFQQLGKPTHCYRKYHFCPNYYNH